MSDHSIGVLGLVLAAVGLVISVVGVVVGMVFAFEEPRNKAAALVRTYWLELTELVLVLCLAIAVFTTPAYRSALLWFVVVVSAIVAIYRRWRLKVEQSKRRDMKKQLDAAEEQNEVAKLTEKKLREEKQELGTRLAVAVEESKELTGKLNLCIPYRKQSKGRWETLKSVRFGHLDYEPFLSYKNRMPCGLGVELLAKLLNFAPGSQKIELLPYDNKGDWGNILSGLEHDYDVVATPLFATFERSKSARFTSPLFFSNIGLYVSRQTASDPEWRCMTVDTIRSVIAQMGKLKLLSIEGEISEKLALKYADKGSIEQKGRNVVIDNLFNIVADNKTARSAFFCESFYAHNHHMVTAGDVVNVLRMHEILYPVCFAVRLGDYQLANLLNIRLLEFTRSDGALDLLASQLARDAGGNLDVNEVKMHFVDQWPRKPAKREGVNV